MATNTERSEIAQRGEAIYQKTLRPLLETEENIGKYLVIDVRNEDYEVGENHAQVALKMLAKSSADQLYALRIGYRTLGTIGGAMKRRTDG